MIRSTSGSFDRAEPGPLRECSGMDPRIGAPISSTASSGSVTRLLSQSWARARPMPSSRARAPATAALSPGVGANGAEGSSAGTRTATVPESMSAWVSSSKARVSRSAWEEMTRPCWVRRRSAVSSSSRRSARAIWSAKRSTSSSSSAEMARSCFGLEQPSVDPELLLLLDEHRGQRVRAVRRGGRGPSGDGGGNDVGLGVSIGADGLDQIRVAAECGHGGFLDRVPIPAAAVRFRHLAVA